MTSYDYDAPLTESGQYTAKYNATREMIAAYDPLYETLRLVNLNAIQSQHPGQEELEGGGNRFWHRKEL